MRELQVFFKQYRKVYSLKGYTLGVAFVFNMKLF